MSRSRYDATAMALYVLGIASAIVGLAFWPFVFGPVAVLLVLAATIMSRGNQRLGRIAVSAAGLFWLIGASIAIWYSNPLY